MNVQNLIYLTSKCAYQKQTVKVCACFDQRTVKKLHFLMCPSLISIHSLYTIILYARTEWVTYSVHIQGVHSEVIGVQVKGIKELLHGDLLPFQLVHYTLRVHAVGLLDEAQQVLLVHAGGSVDVGVHLEWQERGSEWVVGVGVVIAPLHHKREPETHVRRMAAASGENHRTR